MDLIEVVSEVIRQLYEQHPTTEKTGMKIIKLVYYVYGVYYAKYNEPLFDDDIEAGQYGPMIPRLFNLFKFMDGIDKPLGVSNMPKHINATIKNVVEILGDATTVTLSTMSSQESLGVNNTTQFDMLHLQPLKKVKGSDIRDFFRDTYNIKEVKNK